MELLSWLGQGRGQLQQLRAMRWSLLSAPATAKTVVCMCRWRQLVMFDNLPWYQLNCKQMPEHWYSNNCAHALKLWVMSLIKSYPLLDWWYAVPVSCNCRVWSEAAWRYKAVGPCSGQAFAQMVSTQTAFTMMTVCCQSCVTGNDPWNPAQLQYSMIAALLCPQCQLSGSFTRYTRGVSNWPFINNCIKIIGGHVRFRRFVLVS